MAGAALSMLATGMTAVTVADGDSGGEAKKAGPIALLVILLLAVACYFLFRSMTRHLRKVREEFPEDPPTEPGDEPPSTNGPSSAQPGRGPSSP
jgi:hypothetical protein